MILKFYYFFSGIITAISAFDSSAAGIFVGILLLFIAVGFILAAGGDLLLLTKVHSLFLKLYLLCLRFIDIYLILHIFHVLKSYYEDHLQIHRIYRTSDASVSKAQQEFATTFLRNEHVQNAASNVAATAVRTQMANAAQPRY